MRANASSNTEVLSSSSSGGVAGQGRWPEAFHHHGDAGHGPDKAPNAISRRLMAKAPPAWRRFASLTTAMAPIIRSASSPNDNDPSPCDEGPLYGCYLGWLMGLEMANQVVDLIEKVQEASRAVPLSVPPVRAGLHETTNSDHSDAIRSPSQWLFTPH